MSNYDFPSSLTNISIKTKKEDFSVTLPKNELFRVKKIFFENEYDIPEKYIPQDDIVVVDIGANAGLFALYMSMRKSIREIHCFEPTPGTVEILKRNIGKRKNIHVHPFGLTDHDGTGRLAIHPNNSGENSLVKETLENATYVDVSIQNACSAMDRLNLNFIDVLKIDTEGSEVPILKSLMPRLKYVGIVLLEYHSEGDRRMVDKLLDGFSLFEANAYRIGLGIVKYINNSLLGGRTAT